MRGCNHLYSCALLINKKGALNAKSNFCMD